MINILLIIVLFFSLPAESHAQTPSGAFDKLRECVMANDAPGCKALLTPGSYALFDRFAKYNLMPCLPTNFSVESEKPAVGHTIVTASMPAGNSGKNLIHLYYTSGNDPKLDIPYTLQKDMGEKWDKKIAFAEQLYILMKANMGDELTCDKLVPLIK